MTDYKIPNKLPLNCFRTYDIRGEVNAANITADLAYAIGMAVGSQARSLQQTSIIVGRDGRLSGPELTDALIAGLKQTGLNIIFIGQVPTPLVYFATNRLATNSGVMVTASHNPGGDNGFKIVLDGKTLQSDGIQALLKRIQTNDFISYRDTGLAQAALGTVSNNDNVTEEYLDYITSHIKLDRQLKIVIDCGNGAGGDIAPVLFKKLGCDVTELYCDIDGTFPNHHPDPTVPDNLKDIINKVKEVNADIGLAFDGDADRLGIVTNEGKIVWPDRQMMLFAIDVLSRHPESEIIFDVKCSSHLPEIIKSHNGKPIMWQTGHSLIKAKLFEQNAPLAGEMSGHIFFNDEWFGFDDGMYVAARLLRILASQNNTSAELFNTLPHSFHTPELKLPMPEEKKASFMQKLINKADFNGVQEKITIDGLRAEFENGWGLIRPSNTSAYLILRFESDTQAGLDNIQSVFREQLLKLDNQLKLPF